MESSIRDMHDIENKVARLVEKMTLEEKIGQLCLLNCSEKQATASFRERLIAGQIGGILNQVNIDTVEELQRIAMSESRLGIPLLVGRDVIHGFKTIFPIPLGQAATWNPDLIERTARVAAIEAIRAGINWTYAPMLDIARDPRWGRVAESLGEDPYLTSKLGAAMVRGFQGEDLSHPLSIAACAKHFAGYGASESGRDYNSTNIPPNELRNVHLPPFKAAIEAGVASIMTSFSDLDGIPATANEFLLRRVLREDWEFDGMVVSDWGSVSQLQVHGLTVDDRESALRAATAGVDMEMASETYADHLATLVSEGEVSVDHVNEMVANVLRLKYRLGLFNGSNLKKRKFLNAVSSDSLAVAKEAALESVVLLTNNNKILPMNKRKLSSIAVIGPMADESYEQLGTWIFDGDPDRSQTPLASLSRYVKDVTTITHAAGLSSARSSDTAEFAQAVEVAEKADIVLLFVGEDAILSGEAHCRADISLPGAQEQLIEEISATGTPVVLIVMTGRPLALECVVSKVDAMLCAWHPGNMAGPAIIDLLFGEQSPSGKLPVTFPRVTGQVPIYYAHRNTGRPPTRDSIIDLEGIESGAPQHSFGDTSFYLDTDYRPLFPFGYGLSYAQFRYDNIEVSASRVALGDRFTVSAQLTNDGDVEATEIVQLYVRDLAGSLTRPVKELRGFQRLRLKPKQTVTVSFELSTDDLAFYGPAQKLVTEPGQFHVWIGGSSTTDLRAEFEISASS